MWELAERVYNYFLGTGVEQEVQVAEKEEDGFVVLSGESEEDAQLRIALEEAERLRLELEQVQQDSQRLADDYDVVSSRVARPITFAYGRNLDADLEDEFAAMAAEMGLEAPGEDAELDELEREFGITTKTTSSVKLG